MCSHNAGDRLAWIALVDDACATAERRRRAVQRKDRDRVQAALAFIEQAKAVLLSRNAEDDDRSTTSRFEARLSPEAGLDA